MSAPVEMSTSTKKRAMEADGIGQEDVEAKKRKLREEKDQDVEAEKRNNGREEEEEEEDDGESKRNNGREEEDVERKKRNNLGKAEEKVSSVVLFPEAHLFMSDPEAYIAQFCKDEKEPDPEVEIPTLDRFIPPTFFRTRDLIPIREPGSNKAVLSAAKFLLGVSSSLGGKLLKRCSGFLIDWDEGSQTGTVLTTANLIRTKDPPHSDVWIDGAHYDLKADITVHLLDGTSADGQLLYHQSHYDLAFLSVKVNQPVQLPSFKEGVQFAQKVFRLGRDDSSILRITYGRAEYVNPDMYERYHNMYF